MCWQVRERVHAVPLLKQPFVHSLPYTSESAAARCVAMTSDGLYLCSYRAGRAGCSRGTSHRVLVLSGWQTHHAGNCSIFSPFPEPDK